MQSEGMLNELLGRVFRDSSHAVVSVRPDLTIRYANAVAESLAGVSPGGLAGVSCYSGLVGASHQCPGCGVSGVFEDGIAWVHTHTVSGPDGADHPVTERWLPVLDEDGSAESVLIISDIETALPGAPISASQPGAVDATAECTAASRMLGYTVAAIVTLDATGVITRANQSALTLLGRAEGEVVGRDWFEEFLPFTKRVECHELLEKLAEGEVVADSALCEADVVRPDGSARRVEWHLVFVHGEGAADPGVVCTGIDVTRRFEAETELRFRSGVLDRANDAIVVHDAAGKPVYANERACAMCGYKPDEFLRLEPFGWLDPEHREMHEAVRETLALSGAAIFEARYLHRDGTRIPVEVHASTEDDVSGRQLIVAAGRDISERQASQSAMTRLAFYDPLTGLANRTLFLDRLRHAYAVARRTGERTAIAFVDLDHFKKINDSAGHQVGDAVLVEIAKRMRASVRDADTIARLGGDEFAVILVGIGDTTDAEQVAAKLLGCFREPVVALGQEVVITASIGVAFGSAEEEDTGILLGKADTAMYRAKHGGRDTYYLHDEAMADESRERSGLKKDLVGAAERGEFELRYLPIVRIVDEVVVGVEALVRWNHPSMGQIAPSTFLPLAEESSVTVDLGRWVMQDAIRQFALWREAGLLLDARLTVNLSKRQFSDPGMPAYVGKLLDEYRLDSSSFEVEITEGTLQECEDMSATWRELRALGVRVSIDDFGIGHSSIDQLLRFGVNSIKIDREFVRGLGRDARLTAVCHTAISLGHQLGITVVAEGVETRIQYACLRAEKCDEIQGYLVTPALPPGTLEAMLDKDDPLHREGLVAGGSRYRAYPGEE